MIGPRVRVRARLLCDDEGEESGPGWLTRAVVAALVTVGAQAVGELLVTEAKHALARRRRRAEILTRVADQIERGSDDGDDGDEDEEDAEGEA